MIVIFKVRHVRRKAKRELVGLVSRHVLGKSGTGPGVERSNSCERVPAHALIPMLL